MGKMKLTDSQKYEIKLIKDLLKQNDILEFKLDIHAFVHAITYYRLEIPIDHISLNRFNDHYIIEHIIHNEGKLILIIYKRFGA